MFSMFDLDALCTLQWQDLTSLKLYALPTENSGFGFSEGFNLHAFIEGPIYGWKSLGIVSLEVAAMCLMAPQGVFLID